MLLGGSHSVRCQAASTFAPGIHLRSPARPKPRPIDLSGRMPEHWLRGAPGLEPIGDEASTATREVLHAKGKLRAEMDYPGWREDLEALGLRANASFTKLRSLLEQRLRLEDLQPEERFLDLPPTVREVALRLLERRFPLWANKQIDDNSPFIRIYMPVAYPFGLKTYAEKVLPGLDPAELLHDGARLDDPAFYEVMELKAIHDEQGRLAGVHTRVELHPLSRKSKPYLSVMNTLSGMIHDTYGNNGHDPVKSRLYMNVERQEIDFHRSMYVQVINPTIVASQRGHVQEMMRVFDGSQHFNTYVSYRESLIRYRDRLMPLGPSTRMRDAEKPDWYQPYWDSRNGEYRYRNQANFSMLRLPMQFENPTLRVPNGGVRLEFGRFISHGTLVHPRSTLVPIVADLVAEMHGFRDAAGKLVTPPGSEILVTAMNTPIPGREVSLSQLWQRGDGFEPFDYRGGPPPEDHDVLRQDLQYFLDRYHERTDWKEPKLRDDWLERLYPWN